MPLRLSNLIHKSDLHGVFYFYNSSICFDRDIMIDDITNQHIIKISGAVFNIYKPPKLTWSVFNLNDHNVYCPSKYSFQQGLPDSNLVSHWIKSTITIVSPEMLLKSYSFSISNDVIHLINHLKWDGLFCQRSYFTNSGNWSPSLINPSLDNMIHLLEDEINFFMSLKKMIHQEKISLKFYHSREFLLPSQVDFILDEGVMLIMSILSIWNKDLWNYICQFLPLNNKLSQLWRLEILFYYPDRKSLKKHFQECNDLNYNFQVPI